MDFSLDTMQRMWVLMQAHAPMTYLAVDQRGEHWPIQVTYRADERGWILHHNHHREFVPEEFFRDLQHPEQLLHTFVNRLLIHPVTHPPGEAQPPAEGDVQLLPVDTLTGDVQARAFYQGYWCPVRIRANILGETYTAMGNERQITITEETRRLLGPELIYDIARQLYDTPHHAARVRQDVAQAMMDVLDQRARAAAFDVPTPHELDTLAREAARVRAEMAHRMATNLDARALQAFTQTPDIEPTTNPERHLPPVPLREMPVPILHFTFPCHWRNNERRT